MAPYLPQTVVVVEFSNPGDALSALLQIQESEIAQVTLMGMFDPDEEQRSFVIDKKEQQKIEDDFEKTDKQIDTYISKQLPMLISPEIIKD